MARAPGASRSTSARSPICATPDARKRKSPSWRYARANGLWHDPDAAPRYTQTIEIDLASLRVSLAGPRRPQDRLDAAQVPAALRDAIGVSGAADARVSEAVPVDAAAATWRSRRARTRPTRVCSSSAGLRKNARRQGLKPPAWVKTSLAPGSPPRRAARVPACCRIWKRSGSRLRAMAARHASATGPLLPVVSEAIARGEAEPVAVLSGNRNFPGRVHANIDSALLASPPIVVAYALAGRALSTSHAIRSERTRAAGRCISRTCGLARRGGSGRRCCDRRRTRGQRGRILRSVERARCTGVCTFPVGPCFDVSAAAALRNVRAFPSAGSNHSPRILCSSSATTSRPTTSRLRVRFPRRATPACGSSSVATNPPT